MILDDFLEKKSYEVRYFTKLNITDIALLPIGVPENTPDKVYSYRNFIIIATNVVEESVTMFNVDYVIDTGFELLV